MLLRRIDVQLYHCGRFALARHASSVNDSSSGGGDDGRRVRHRDRGRGGGESRGPICRMCCKFYRNLQFIFDVSAEWRIWI